MNIRASIISGDGRAQGQEFTTDRLEVGFGGNIVTEFSEQGSSKISQFIMPYRWEAAHMTNHGIVG